MQIKRVYWRKNFFSQLRRNFGSIICDKDNWSKNIRKDHALEWGTRNDNPGYWKNITSRIGTNNNPTVIHIENSNNIFIWVPDNEARGNVPKINQQLFKDDGDVIDTWYYFNFKMTIKLLDEYKKNNNGFSNDEQIFYNFLQQKISLLPSLNNIKKEQLRQWVSNVIIDMSNLNIDMSWFVDKTFKQIKSVIDNSVLLIIECENPKNNETKFYTAASEITTLPSNISSAIANSRDKEGYIELETLDVDKKVLEIINLLKKNKNVILYGPPGTGKSYLMNKVKDILSANNPVFELNDENFEVPFKELIKTGEFKYKWCTFHQSYSYENFVVGIKPKIETNIHGETFVAYENVKGPFLELALDSSPVIWQKDINNNLINHDNPTAKKSLLLIDEINRANTAEVFGDIITVLEPDKRLNSNGDILSKTVPITVNNNYEYNSIDNLEELYMPSDMYILASMNSIDKSIAPLDAAFKRRFKIVNVYPDNKVLLKHYNLSENQIESNIDASDSNFYKIFSYKLFLAINSYIMATKGSDYLLGQAYFWELGEDGDDDKQALLYILKYKVFPQLNELFGDSNEDIVGLFTVKNKNILYLQYENDYEEILRLKSIESIDDESILYGYSLLAGINYRKQQSLNEKSNDFNIYHEQLVRSILSKLSINRNCILSGPPGTGKSYIASVIKKMFEDRSWASKWITFHPSMSYEKFIIGMKPTLLNNKINYEVKNGTVLDLCCKYTNTNKLLIIDEINRGNASEIFGELITLFEKDKRNNYKVELPYEYDNNGVKTKEFSLPNNFYTLGTMNTIDKSVNPLDSALKRRFYIINMNPDYHLLELYFETTNVVIGETIETKEEQLKLSISMLREINYKIIKYKGEDYQLGHAYIWSLKGQDNPIEELANILDNNIINNIIDMFGDDEDILTDIFGKTSPIIIEVNNRVYINQFKDLSFSEKLLSIRRIANV